MIKHANTEILFKRCIFVALMVLACFNVKAYTISETEIGKNFWPNGDQELSSYTKDWLDENTNLTLRLGLTFTVYKNDIRGQLKDHDILISRTYSGTLSIQAPTGYNLKSVTLTFDNGNGRRQPGEVSPSTGSVSESDYDRIWTGNTNSLSLTITATSSEAQVHSISVTYEQASLDYQPDAPKLDPQGGETAPGNTYIGSQHITITNEQPGVDYYYLKTQSPVRREGDDVSRWVKYNGYIPMGIGENPCLTVVAVNRVDTQKVAYTSRYYNIIDSVKAAAPTFSLPSGTYQGIQSMTMSSTDEDVAIYYCTSPTELDASKDIYDSQWNWQLYSSDMPVQTSTYFYAYADGDEYKHSDIVSAHIIIEGSEKPQPGISFEKPEVSISWADKDTYTGQKLTNPNNVQVVWSLWGANADNVAKINLDGTLQIIGSGTVQVYAIYNSTSTSQYSSQIAYYTLTINPEPAALSLTVKSGSTELITINNNTTSDIQQIDVPDGVVLNLVANGFATNSIIMAKVAKDDSSDGYPTYVLKDNGSVNNQEETDDNGYYTLSNFQYLGRGIPVYKSDEPNQPMTLVVRIYNPDRPKNALAQYYLHLNVEDNANRPAPPTALPTTQGNSGERDYHTKLTLSESATVQGEDAATIYAKYSNNSIYTPRELLAEQNVSIGTGKVGVYSTVLNPERRTTALQVRHNQEWKGKIYDVASDVMTAYYYYIPNRNKVRLEAVNNPIHRDLTNDAGNLTDTLHVKCYVNEVAQDELPKALKYTYLSSNPNVVTVSDDGVATMHAAGSATITVMTPQVNGGIKQLVNSDYTADTDNPGYEAAYVAFNVYVTDVANQTLIPPTFSPATDREYYAPFKATVVANVQDEGTDDLAVGRAYYVVVDNQHDGNIDFTNPVNITSPDASVVVASGRVNINGTRSVDIPTVYKDGTDMNDGDTYTIFAVTYNPNKESHQWSDVSSVTFTYRIITVDPPVLSPGQESEFGDESRIYSFVSDSLVITASTTTPGAQVYYTINSASDGVFLSNGSLYSGDTKIVLHASAIVRAMAYYDGVYSRTVTYLYRKARPDIQPPTYTVNGNDLEKASDNTYNVSQIDKEARIFIHCNADVNNDGHLVDITDTSKSYYDTTNGYIIYYTTDGTWPTSRSQVYDPRTGLDFEYNVTIRAFCKHLAMGATGLSSQLSIEIVNGVEVWLADTTTTCKGGVLGANIISRNVDNVNTSTAPHDITITLGKVGQKWSANDVIEDYKGNRIDNYGNIDIIAQTTSDMEGGNITDADDELGVLYNHAYAQLNDFSQTYNDTTTSSVKAETRAKGVYESTFKLPSHGTYVKFEPEKDGEVTIWCEQNGGMHYSNGANSNDRFYNLFIRKRPAYFVDEQGVGISASSINASGTLNNRWDEIDRSTLLGMGGIEDGLPQTLFTKGEAQDIYDMYEDKISQARTVNPDERSIRRLIVELNDGNHQLAASAGVDIADDRGTDDNVIDGTGYCIPSASYMKYTFPVRAGKTYFFFAVKTKIGISALGFKATEDTTQRQEITINEGSAASSENETTIENAIENGNTCNVTVNRALTKGKWAAMVLPFSMSATMVKRVFGDSTVIQHYYGFDEGKPISYINLAQHDHQMIVAGTPFFICPAKSMNSFTVKGVQIEKDVIDEVGDQKNGSSVVMNGTYDYQSGATPLWGFYVQGGRLVQARSHAVDQKATRSWLQGLTESVTAKVGFRRGGSTTGISVVNEDSDEHKANTNENIYSISGMIVGRGAEELQQLRPGVYIYKGNKIIIGSQDY